MYCRQVAAGFDFFGKFLGLNASITSYAPYFRIVLLPDLISSMAVSNSICGLAKRYIRRWNTQLEFNQLTDDWPRQYAAWDQRYGRGEVNHGERGYLEKHVSHDSQPTRINKQEESPEIHEIHD